MGISLPPNEQERLDEFLGKSKDVFTWSYEDLIGIDPKITIYHLNMDQKFKLFKQKIRSYN